MAALRERPLGELLDEVASAGGGPSAGACAAWACALACALVELVAEVTAGRADRPDAHPRMGDLRAAARRLRDEALALGERDVAAYAAVLDAERRGDADATRAALSAAADVPLALAEDAAEAAELAAQAAAAGVPAVRGDAIAAARLGAAAAAAAAELVAVNLASRPDPRIPRARAAAARAAVAQEPAA
jgi:formiminotetrahydrofolate cyclodeaminase